MMFQGIVITDGVAAKSFAIFTYQRTCSSLLNQWPNKVTIGFQGEGDFFALYNPLSYWDDGTEGSGSAEPGSCASGYTAEVNRCNLVYQLSPKPSHDMSKY